MYWVLQVEFVRFGQALKLDTIVKGDAQTSLATTGLFKRTVSGDYYQVKYAGWEGQLLPVGY